MRAKTSRRWFLFGLVFIPKERGSLISSLEIAIETTG